MLLLMGLIVALATTGCGGNNGSVFQFSNRSPKIDSFRANGQEAPAATTDTTGTSGTSSGSKPNITLTVTPSSKVTILCLASDKDNDPLTYQWTASDGTIATNSDGSPLQSQIQWTAGTTEENVTITCTVNDGRGGVVSRSMIISVQKSGTNHPPTATIAPAAATLASGATQVFTVTATDQDAGDTLTYAFFASQGTITQSSTTPSTATYTAPATAGTYTVYCIVQDGRGSYVNTVAQVTVGAK